MASYLFFSHDGYGLGHIRRNCVIAGAVRRAEPDARVVLVTGVPNRPPWLRRWGRAVVRVPPLLKGEDGRYGHSTMTFSQALARRGEIFAQTVQRVRPDVVVVDRHPFGTAGELREGLEDAAARGVPLVLGLRDVLDEPDVVAEEVRGHRWEGMPELYRLVLVYGARHLCDHQEEYGLPIEPAYCGWVVERPVRARRDPHLLAAAAGGGGDGAAVFGLATRVLRARPSWRGELAAGPFGDPVPLRRAARDLDGRLTVHRGISDCRELFARAGAVLEMAGYNSTFEALAEGHRPILVPRRHPRREQAIRADRLAAMGLADVVDPEADGAGAERLLDRCRSLPPRALQRAGIDLDGAWTAAALIRRAARGGDAA